MPSEIKRRLLGVRVDDLTLAETLQQIEQRVADRDSTPGLIITANPEYVMAARRNGILRALIENAHMVTPDGVGLLYAGKLLGQPFRQRVTGVALTYALAKRSSETGLRLFLLGAAPGIAEAAAEKLRQLYPGVNIVGCRAGEAGPEGDVETLAILREAEPDIILVAYGMLKQDYWSARNLTRSGARVSIGVGGVLDYLSGRVKLAPTWIRRAGLEWLYRLYREPWRWRRIFIAVPYFGSVVLLEYVRQRFVKKSRKTNG